MRLDSYRSTACSNTFPTLWEFGVPAFGLLRVLCPHAGNWSRVLAAAQRSVAAGSMGAVQALQHLGCHDHIRTYCSGLPLEIQQGAEIWSWGLIVFIQHVLCIFIMLTFLHKSFHKFFAFPRISAKTHLMAFQKFDADVRLCVHHSTGHLGSSIRERLETERLEGAALSGCASNSALSCHQNRLWQQRARLPPGPVRLPAHFGLRGSYSLGSHTLGCPAGVCRKSACRVLCGHANALLRLCAY